AVYSKTSIQSMRIEPANPRVIYFNDAVSVGWVRGGFLELAAQDPGKGIHYYVLQQRPGEQITARQDCARCHAGGALQVRTAVTRADGVTSSEADMTLATRFSRLFGGWFVTGRQIPPGHQGNAVAPTLGPKVALRPTSDIVALLVFIHQMRVMNLIAHPEKMDELASALVFADEAPLPGPIRGDSEFAKEFAARGGLREFDLEHTLMRYPCSYMIASDAFRALAPGVKDGVYRRMEELLRGGGATPFAESARKKAIEMIGRISGRR
ncbi:MAG TPA: hypothetical protein VHA14_16710, partial [Bryobacteraceae bacterium]|nr:hypothetical protein [Bryobacteraceae bacterium]